MEHTLYLALGTNLGNKEENICNAYAKIEEQVWNIIKRSSLYQSKPWGFTSNNDFINTVICCETNLTPHEVLDTIKAIEREMGRTIKSENGVYHDRIIDIDILFYDDITVEENDLHIPHPLMKERDFVMVPLKEVLDNDHSTLLKLKGK